MLFQTKYLLVLITVFVYCLSAPAQTDTLKSFRREFSIIVDNDYPFQTDQYYTAGQDLYFRFVINSKIGFLKNDDFSKTILSFRYGNKVFTPKNLDTRNTIFMDRPYCGWSFVSAEILNFRKYNSANSFILQMGIVGEISGMYKIQPWIHKVLDLYSVYGWDSQIANEFVVNINYIHTQGFSLRKGVELVSASGAWVGTGLNKITQEFTFRLFKFNPLSESSYMNAIISVKNSTTRKDELFMFFSLETDLVLSNIFIQGSLFNNPSPLTTGINNWLFMPKVGMQYSSRRISAVLSVTHITKETPFVDVHNYTTTSLAYRF